MSRWHITAEPVATDWWDQAGYQSLLKADGRQWAWIWLKRNHLYQAQARMPGLTVRPIQLGKSACCLRTTNLKRLCKPGIFVHSGRIGDSDPDEWLFWRADLDASVLAVTADPISRKHPDAFDVAHFPGHADLVRDRSGREMAVLSDGGHQIQLQVGEGTLSEGPVRLRYEMGGFDQAEAKLRTVARLTSLRRHGHFARGLFPDAPGAARMALALQAYDGLVAGASQRDIAIALFGDQMVREEWNGRSDFLRARVQRLINIGRNMVDGGYKRLLK
jgi:hypothetical protein